MILLDTHAWICWVSNPDRLPAAARDAIEARVRAGEPVRVSAISAWEVAMLVEKGRLQLTLAVDEWIGRSHAAPEIEFVRVDPWIAVRSVQLSAFPHSDPADRIIVATALMLRAQTRAPEGPSPSRSAGAGCSATVSPRASRRSTSYAYRPLRADARTGCRSSGRVAPSYRPPPGKVGGWRNRSIGDAGATPKT